MAGYWSSSLLGPSGKQWKALGQAGEGGLWGLPWRTAFSDRERERSHGGEGRIWWWRRKCFQQKSPFYWPQQGLDLGWDTQATTLFLVSLAWNTSPVAPAMPSPKIWEGRTSSTSWHHQCQGSSDLCAAHMLSARCEIHPVSVLGRRMGTSRTQGGLIQRDCKCFYMGPDAN